MSLKSAGYYSLVGRITAGFRWSYLSHGASAEVESTTADNYILVIWPSIMFGLLRQYVDQPSWSQMEATVLDVVQYAFAFRCAFTAWIN